MYEIFHKSLITLGHHIDVAGAYAGNGRLFEAVGKEIVAYCLAEGCTEMVQYYLEHDEERQAIALAG